MARKPKLGLPLQTLRNAPDALEGRRLRGGILEVDPAQVETEGRLDDRLEMDLDGLMDSIERHGQRVPILLRPLGGERYRLIYGHRRLEACRLLGLKARAIVTEIEGEQALRDQLIENQERRDLSFIERALVADALLEGDHLEATERNNRGVAEVLNLTEQAVSQLTSVVRFVGDDLIRAIGPAPGIGRPRWEDLKRVLSVADLDREALAAIAARARERAGPGDERSDKAFLAVLSAARDMLPGGESGPAPALEIEGVGSARIALNARGTTMRLELTGDERDFIAWLAVHAPDLITELHARWKGAEGD